MPHRHRFLGPTRTTRQPLRRPLTMPLILGCSFVLSVSGPLPAQTAPADPDAAASITKDADAGTIAIENRFLKRTFSVEGGTLRTIDVLNKLDGETLRPRGGAEFALRLSEGTHLPEGDRFVDSADFVIEETGVEQREDGVALTFVMRGRDLPVKARVQVTLEDGEPWLRKRIEIASERRVVLERIDLEVLELPEAVQPYPLRRITAQGEADWKPGLGQPLYTTIRTGSFWGVEFPAADNTVDEGSILRCGYPHGRPLEPGISYHSHPSVMGVTDDPRFVRDAFLDYIDRIRVRPLRLQVQYNSWFDHGPGVDRASFARSVQRIHHELVEERGVPPLRAYVIDDGWQDTSAPWTDKVWKVNGKFDSDFGASRAAAEAAGSRLGLWMSPGCLFGAQGAIAALREAGFESIDPWMSMAGPRYMGLLEERMVELTRQGVAYFKLDGLFGHYITRNFELHGARYGLPEMPQLTAAEEGLTGSDARLNDPKFDELKTCYLAAGAERLMRLFAAMAEADPEVYIVISNGAWLSPWWLQHVDSVWMINAGDAAEGSTRTEELVYRDGRYHELWETEQTQFPLAALFNHEPKKTRSREAKDVFRRYLYMNLSRGTGFVELYITPGALNAYDWDVLAEGLRWTHAVFPTFRRVRMHGGSPEDGEVYGYAAWNAEQGYVSLHNPSDAERPYEFTLDRAFGLPPHVDGAPRTWHLTSPIADCLAGLPREVRDGDTLNLTLQPKEIRIVNFGAAPHDWSDLVALQQRTTDDFDPSSIPPIAGHPVLGSWVYQWGGGEFVREFTPDGFCTLRDGDKAVWRYSFVVESATEVLVAGTYLHRLEPDGTMTIEGRYHASRR